MPAVTPSVLPQTIRVTYPSSKEMSLDEIKLLYINGVARELVEPGIRSVYKMALALDKAGMIHIDGTPR